MIAPFGGFGPMPVRARSGVNPGPWRRTASRGMNRWLPPRAMSSVNCSSGVMSSRIQNARPWVAATRSWVLNVRSWMGTTGRLSWSGCHPAPSSNETYTPNSVPANSSPRRAGSSRTTRTKCPAGIPATIFLQVFP